MLGRAMAPDPDFPALWDQLIDRRRLAMGQGRFALYTTCKNDHDMW